LIGSGRDLILRYYPDIPLEGLIKTTKTSIKIAGRRGTYMNPGPPEYEGVFKRGKMYWAGFNLFYQMQER
jgi:hypothetical protein